MNPRILALLCVLVPICSAAPQSRRSPPPPTRADYGRADSILLLRPGLLKNRVVIPNWMEPSDQFWYRRERVSGFDIVIVDAATGRKRPAFDAGSLAARVARTTGGSVSADSLPLDSLTLAPGAQDPHLAYLTVKRTRVRCRLDAADAACDTLAAIRGELLPSPDGRLAVFTKGANLWLRDLGTGAEHALTTDGVSEDFGYAINVGVVGTIPRRRAEAQGRISPPSGVSWSPDSRWVIVPLADQRHVALYPFVESVPADGSFRPKMHVERRAFLGEKPATQRLFAINVLTAASHPIALPVGQDLGTGQTSFHRVSWSADNRHLYGTSLLENEEAAALFDVDVASGRARKIVEERSSPRIELNTNLYATPNVFVSRDGANVIWWSQRDGWGHLYLYDGVSGRLKNRITAGHWVVRDILWVDESRRLVYFTANGREPGNPYYRYIYRVGFDGRDLTLLTPEPADHNVAPPRSGGAGLDGSVAYRAISPSGKYVVNTFSTPMQVPETVTRATLDGRLIGSIETADASALFRAGYRPPEEFTVKAADGVTDLWGVIYKPPAFDSSLSYPVVDAQYTSPMVAVAPRTFVAAVGALPSGMAAVLAQLGFIGVVVDGRGTAGRDREFGHAMYGKLATMGLEDHMAAIKQLGRRYAFIDTTRVGITGDSYGGWSTIRALIEFPDFFKVGVAGNAPGGFHNMQSFANVQGRPVYSGGDSIHSSSTVPTNYMSLDTRQQVDRLTGKLMMIVSELDENVVPASSLQLIDAFMRADKDVEVLYLPDTGHGFGKYAGPVWRRTWDFFVRNLMGAEPPPYRMKWPW